jgi:hypothetical protein
MIRTLLNKLNIGVKPMVTFQDAEPHKLRNLPQIYSDKELYDIEQSRKKNKQIMDEHRQNLQRMAVDSFKFQQAREAAILNRDPKDRH